MMIWHDCKSDPPKKDGEYLLVYKYYGGFNWILTFDRVWYSNGWSIIDGYGDWYPIKEAELGGTLAPIKWTEVDLSEVE